MRSEGFGSRLAKASKKKRPDASLRQHDEGVGCGVKGLAVVWLKPQKRKGQMLPFGQHDEGDWIL
ncbi:MAG: hypothetical protein VB108_09225, partial [Anaerolineaceae bacterium]|nr:hypothetical protein [Anaerolineaceae bacterium]